MFLSKFRKHRDSGDTLIERVEAYTQPLGTDARITTTLAERHMTLLVDRFERELKRYGDA